MQKKVVSMLIILIFVIFVALPVLAHPTDEYTGNSSIKGITGDSVRVDKNEEGKVIETDLLEVLLQEIIKSKNLGETEQFLLKWSKPINNNSNVYKDFELLSGCINKKNDDKEINNINTSNNVNDDKDDNQIITVVISRYTEKTDTYEEYKNNEGESRWDIKESGSFFNEVKLSEGVNKLKIIVFKRPAKPIPIGLYVNSDVSVNVNNDDASDARVNASINANVNSNIGANINANTNASIYVSVIDEAKLREEIRNLLRLELELASEVEFGVEDEVKAEARAEAEARVKALIDSEFKDGKDRKSVV